MVRSALTGNFTICPPATAQLPALAAFAPESYAEVDAHVTRYRANRDFEIYPAQRTFSENGKPPEPSVADPLDEASFIYFLRTIPLEPGKTYDFDRYFRPDRNPVRVIVLRRERITVPAGTFNTVVVRPVIKAKGLFAEGGQAEVWLTDDSSRTMVQMRSHLPIGSLSLYLTGVRH